MNNNMNEDQLENLLRGIAPAAVSPALRQRVDEELKLDMSWLGTQRSSPRQRRRPHWIMSAGWAAMGAAAAIAVMSYLPQQSGANANAVAVAAPTPVEVPGTTLREWDDSKDNGIHTGRSRLAEKHILVVSRELGTWVDPRYASETSLDISSRQQLLQPVSYR